ncbi:nucleotidyltransferase-like protein [Paenibacillus sp. Marseille-Q4541]|uniref:nucleotidyltransferase-like protein n=1 Tax=Paenibacillus sp. Marseille-Q4541 TaxID=2831522 RepID=UPI001BA6281C
MELTNFSFLSEESVNQGVVGAIAYPHSGEHFHGSLMQDFEVYVLILHEDSTLHNKIRHSIIGELRYQIVYMDWAQLNRYLITGEDRSVTGAFMDGDILWDRDDELLLLRQHVLQFGNKVRKQKIFYEFSCFLKTYVEAKRWLADGQVIDAYQCVLKSLKHWARIVVIEKGIPPERAVWTQIRDMDRAVYKLYDELTSSKETLEQRVELTLLACEFSVMSKMESSSELLIEVLRKSNQPVSLAELMAHHELQYIHEELPLMLRKLVHRSIIKETGSWIPSLTESGREIRYFVD